MERPLAYGIDFGTSNSSIAVAYDDRVEVLEVEPTESQREILPSIVYLHRDGQRSAGQEAVEQYLVTGAQRHRCAKCPLVEFEAGRAITDCEQYAPGSGCHDARLIVGIKSTLSAKGFESTHSWARHFTLPDLVGVVLGRLKREADAKTGHNVKRAVLGHPVVFVGAEGTDFQARQTVARERLGEAAQRAGFEEVIFMQEPAAALIDEDLEEGVVVAADFGGGTFDVAVCRLTPDGGDVTALQGAAIGGERFDAALFDAKVAPFLGLDSEFVAHGKTWSLPNWFRARLRQLSGIRELLNDSRVYTVLDGIRGSSEIRKDIIEEILFGGQAFHFYKAIESAKIQLSSKMSTSIEFHRPGIDVSIPVSRAEFEAVIANDLEVVHERIGRALNQAGLRPDQVDLVVRTGGSSSIPAFATQLEEMFGHAKIAERPVYTTIVSGLGTEARRRWAS